MNQIKERPILFNAAMVRAVLDGSKTQTRRIVKPQCELTSGSGFSWKGFLYGSAFTYSETVRNFAAKACPHGKPGDQLWVRETFSAMGDKTCHALPIYYRADRPDDKGGWTPSIHMPRWASRIQLEITNVRVERLNEISEAGAMAEGCNVALYVDDGMGNKVPPKGFNVNTSFPSARHWFSCLWESINGAGSWNENIWVWVIEFKRITNGATGA